MSKQKKGGIINNFRLTLVNDDTHDKLWSRKFTRMGALVTAITTVVVTITVIFCLIAFTPIRTLIPGYPDARTKHDAIQNAIRVDSLQNVIMKWELYSENLRRVVDGQEPLKIDINRTPGGYKMESRPAKINIDTYAARSSMGYGEYNASDFNQREADRGFKIAYQGVARIVNEGDQLARGVSPSEIAAQQMRAGATIETAIDFLPKGGADVSFDKGTLSINYTPTDINIDWENINSSVVEFVPGNIEFIVKEHPRVEIEYVGEPIYVPPSANPAYVAPKKLNTKG